ncbi:hypothetical protein CC78DRAFT_478949 [Lojkania enalia]|uniref:Glycosyltransferase 2-like domain-containing protein n=1 Tax=Lojkania enalia TaxID=147567 RepID=A0A9P4N4J7_9PLEO|nr:hypothetical protein CC78DRAFT_478949 [Didymosphaeria enalia]
MVKFLHRRCSQAKWLEPPEDEYGVIDGGAANLGVLLRRADGIYTAEPLFLNPKLVAAVERLGVAVAFTMSSEITFALLQQVTPFQTELSLNPRGFTLPIVKSVQDIASGKSSVTRDSFVCLCKQERMVLVWGDTVPGILAHGTDIETRLLGLVWGSHIPSHSSVSPHQHAPAVHSHQPSTNGHTRSSGFPISAPMDGPVPSEMSEKIGAIGRAIEVEEMGDRVFDPEKEAELPERKFLLVHAVTIGIAMILVIVVEMACLAKLITEYRLDGSMIRFALVATIPLFASFSLFYFIVIGGSLGQLFGPLSALQENSIYYSGKAPKPGRHRDYELPHVTIQMPVYKEGLKGVIIPTVTSLLAAVKYYESHGGTASIFVNEDGMQCVSQEMQEARKAFYELNNIGWVARPKDNQPKKEKKGGLFSKNKAQDAEEGEKEDTNHFIRAGHFKKASNMNYCLDFSLRVEDELQRLISETCDRRGCTQDDLTVEEEDELYEQARNNMLDQDEGHTWAAGNVRVGEIILIVDSDTRVPEDCLLYGALEMYESPEVALLQHASGIMQVVNNVFENGITYFTDLVYTSIQYAVGNGDCAPFVGHNTFIRWKAIQSIAFQKDGKTKFWSEDHVSEDFDVSLRLQINKFVVRLATYHNGGFKEGVSLTVYDELARWEKYAYGCNELVFHPLIKWPTKGPITPLFRKFLLSPIKVTSKVTILAYIGTYYAIASAIPLSLANYLLVGWFNESIDQFYITSWKIFVGMAVVFNVLSPLAYAMLRHRLGHKTFFWSVVESAKWMPFFLLFFGGLSFHLLKAIFCHFFSVQIEWTATAKELTESGFRVGLDRIVRDFKYMYLFLFPLTAGIIYLATSAPRGWEITDFAAIVPLSNQVGCHALLPFALGLF